MGWYAVIKTVKGRRYLYRQRTWREGKRVRTESKYVGALDASGGGGPTAAAAPLDVAAIIKKHKRTPHGRAIAAAERAAARIEQEQRAEFGETAAERAGREHQEHLDQLHAAYGLVMPGARSNPAPVAPAAAAPTPAGPAPAAPADAAIPSDAASPDAASPDAAPSDGAP